MPDEPEQLPDVSDTWMPMLVSAEMENCVLEFLEFVSRAIHCAVLVSGMCLCEVISILETDWAGLISEGSLLFAAFLGSRDIFGWFVLCVGCDARFSGWALRFKIVAVARTMNPSIDQTRIGLDALGV